MPTPVLLLVRSLDLGGSERQMAEVAKSLDRRYFEPHVACFHSEGIRGEELRSAGVPILRLPVTSFASFSAVRGAAQLIRYIWRHNIRIVHSFDVPLNIFAVPAARAAMRPIVLSSQRAHRGLTPGAYHKLLRVTDRLVNGIVVNCEYMRRHLEDDEHVPAKMIHLCYNGIDTGVFAPGPPPGLAGDADLVIGIVCALRPEKGLSTLMEAFGSFSPACPGAKLVIVGSGPCLGELQAQARALNIFDKCVFVPKTNDVTPWLRTFDIFVLPSLSEAFSNSLMEAMACGCCAVASRVGGNPELVGNSERGVLFEKQNARELAAIFASLAANPERRRQLAEAGMRFIREGFTLAASVTRMQQIYTSFLTSNR
jgi:glycosyltransferase involved in cell wall biosynthesis